MSAGEETPRTARCREVVEYIPAAPPVDPPFVYGGGTVTGYPDYEPANFEPLWSSGSPPLFDEMPDPLETDIAFYFTRFVLVNAILIMLVVLLLSVFA